MDSIKDLSEEDVKLRFITPAITSKGWSFKDISMEKQVKFTDGKINLQGNIVARQKPKYADYVLYFNRATPLAIVEAKDANHSVSYGLQQAMEYAQMMDVPFAYSSNGLAFAEHDFLTGEEREFGIDEFPTREELSARFKAESNATNGLSSEEEKVMNQPFYSDQNVFSPRYYQRVAINRTLQAIARGQKRLLLVMATGTGKTYTAFQIVWRLLKSGMVKKVLYLADRNVLIDQTLDQDFAPLKKVAWKVCASKADPAMVSSYQVYFSLYQQLIGQDGAEHYKELFPNPNIFDLVIIDECHRGSAKDDSSWRQILDYFSSATHLGMTATPKETKYQSSITYFGEPIYKYSLNDGINDGFLAPFKVINSITNIGDNWRPTKGQTDIYGNEIEDRIYNNSDYDYNIIIEDRIHEVAHRISAYLKATDRMARTIVFCANEDHAERMRMALVNENKDLCKTHPDYIVRITGSDEYGQSKLSYFISASAKYPVIATTSKLLSTGVDCKMVRLIVLDQQIGSMTEFKQIIGRGTRLREKEGKLHFVVMDFRNVTRLFADPDWDGPITVDDNYIPSTDEVCPVCGQSPCICPPKPHICPVCGQDPCVCPPQPKQPKPIVDPEGCPVEIIHETVSVYDPEGKLLRTESITDYTKRNIIDKFANLDSFIQKWREKGSSSEVDNMLREHGIDLAKLKQQQNMEGVDDFDFICHIAYGKKALTRRERVEEVKKRDIFNKYGAEARKVLEALLDKYMNDGISEIEDIVVLRNDPFREMGAPSKIVKLFGGKPDFLKAVQELKETIYNVA